MGPDRSTVNRPQCSVRDHAHINIAIEIEIDAHEGSVILDKIQTGQTSIHPVISRTALLARLSLGPGQGYKPADHESGGCLDAQ
jgi:hypothetical protein